MIGGQVPRGEGRTRYRLPRCQDGSGRGAECSRHSEGIAWGWVRPAADVRGKETLFRVALRNGRISDNQIQTQIQTQRAMTASEPSCNRVVRSSTFSGDIFLVRRLEFICKHAQMRKN